MLQKKSNRKPVFESMFQIKDMTKARDVYKKIDMILLLTWLTDGEIFLENP